MDTILSQIRPAHILKPQSINPILILSSYVRLRSGLFPSGFPTKILYASLMSHACCMLRPPHLPWSDHLNNSTWTVLRIHHQ